MDSELFGQFIARNRKEKGLTQADIANQLGVTDKAISRWERGKGFPDISMLEPLSNVLGISILELMRSKTIDMESDNGRLSKDEVTEIMVNAVEMERENRKQDKTITWISCIVTGVIAVLVKLLTPSSIGGALFVGAMIALGVTGIYLFVKNGRDKSSRKIYSFFMILGIGISIGLLHLIGVDFFFLTWGLYCVFCVVIVAVTRQ